ncbi:HAD hydrolase family protein [bacterium]|nr:HAD hydrolase family protein [bacterium]
MPVSLTSDVSLSQPIRCIISDVDGVMTNGQIIYDSVGVETKAFHVRDGLAIKLWLRSGHSFCILTARESDVVKRRADELGVTHLKQGSEDKLDSAKKLIAEIGCGFENVCYIGDDLPDIPVMRRVGLAVAPADAARDAGDASHWILRSKGGCGAVRECVERLLRSQGNWDQYLDDGI